MEYSLHEKMNRLLMESGYKNRVQVAGALVENGIYKSMNTALSDLHKIIKGKLPASQKFLEGLERLSINPKKFTEIIEEFEK